ncbi:MAG: SRPBCC domain-containing protein [Deltaproteobacteria bacterium]|nr:SRPBCC domain-containing protein [Deltaproteobacteria bacterium]
MQDEHSATIVRVINASANELYAAWTEPMIMKRWLATVVEADVRVGGQFRIENHEKDGTINAFTGEYRVLDPGHRIVQTFHHVSATPGGYEEELLEVILKPLATGVTELRLINSWKGAAMSKDELQALEAGWAQWLDLLIAGVEPISTEEP